MAASTAASKAWMVTASVATKPLPIVVTTAVPHREPIKLHTNAIRMAWRGVSTRVYWTHEIGPWLSNNDREKRRKLG